MNRNEPRDAKEVGGQPLENGEAENQREQEQTTCAGPTGVEAGGADEKLSGATWEAPLGDGGITRPPETITRAGLSRGVGEAHSSVEPVNHRGAKGPY